MLTSDMHAIEGTSNVPAFLTKLWRLVDDHKTNDLICWTENGRSFIIQNQAQFARELLPQYYKHNNMASFVRQLNMYGFHKVVSADSGGLRVEKDEMEFAHPAFQQGCEELIENIKRKQQRRLASDGLDFSQIPTNRGAVEESKKMTKLLGDVRDMKRDHDTMTTKLLGLKRENEALWREYANMRQKFSKQQQIIEKLIHFLIAMVKTPSKPIIQKRKFGHLALEGGDDSTSTAGATLNSLPHLSQSVEILDGLTTGTMRGAKIHEITDLMESDDPSAIPEIFTPESNDPNIIVEEVTTSSPVGTTAAIPEVTEPHTILLVNGDQYNSDANTAVPSASNIYTSPITVTTTTGMNMSSSGLGESQNSKIASYNKQLDEAPLSPELLNTVDPSVVTQSFKYAATPSPTMKTPSNTITRVVAGPSKVQIASKSSSVPTSPGKGKLKGMKMTNTSPRPSMSVAVPEKSFNKLPPELNEIFDLVQFPTGSISSENNYGITQGKESNNEYPPDNENGFRNDLQSHIDDMQNNIETLQEIISTHPGNFNVDPSMLLSMFSSEDNNLPDLDSLSATSGNELSLYHPSLLDLVGINNDDDDDDPMKFLNKSPLAGTSTASGTLSPTNPGKSKAGSSNFKPLSLKIKEERIEDELSTPNVMPPTPQNPLFRGKKRRN